MHVELECNCWSAKLKSTSSPLYPNSNQETIVRCFVKTRSFRKNFQSYYTWNTRFFVLKFVFRKFEIILSKLFSRRKEVHENKTVVRKMKQILFSIMKMKIEVISISNQILFKRIHSFGNLNEKFVLFSLDLLFIFKKRGTNKYQRHFHFTYRKKLICVNSYKCCIIPAMTFNKIHRRKWLINQHDFLNARGISN